MSTLRVLEPLIAGMVSHHEEHMIRVSHWEQICTDGSADDIQAIIDRHVKGRDAKAPVNALPDVSFAEGK